MKKENKQKIPFLKMQGGGNDFIFVSSESYHALQLDKDIPFLCHRKFGIGADGLIMIEPGEDVDFRMYYHNADGGQGGFCGNGARCAVARAEELWGKGPTYSFEAYDGRHTAKIHAPGDVEISMKDTLIPQRELAGFFIDTGSRHYIERKSAIDAISIDEMAPPIRHHDIFSPAGANVNYWEDGPDGLRLRTFEKGVEAETLACGTGIVAVAIVHHFTSSTDKSDFTSQLQAKGGDFQVSGRKVPTGYTELSLRGPAHNVFEGVIYL
jgi:diaminopimelate epimerase